MFTLLPPDDKKKMSQEYRLRLLTVAIAFTGAAVFMASIFLLPSYVVARDKAHQATLKKEQSAKSPLAVEEAKMIANLKEVRDALELAKDPEPTPSKTIAKIQAYQLPGIKIQNIDYRYDPLNSVVVIAGIASTRKDLISFTDSMKADSYFSSVTFPISNLSKNTNIQFLITITGAF